VPVCFVVALVNLRYNGSRPMTPSLGRGQAKRQTSADLDQRRSEMNSKARPPTDYRAIRKRHERWTLIAAIVVLVVVGGGLIGLVFGFSQLLTALPCLLAGGGLLVGLYLLLVGVERWSQG